MSSFLAENNVFSGIFSSSWSNKKSLNPKKQVFLIEKPFEMKSYSTLWLFEG